MKGYNYNTPQPWIYRPKFYRHLHNLTVSGFYTRELDADDFEFLEQVKTRGIANGTLPCTNTVLLEELEYWHLPYAIDWTIKRTHGPVPTRGKGETPELKAIRIAAWKARNAERLANKAISEAEMEREQAQWEADRARRKWRQINTDAEWDAADPARKAKTASGSASGKRKLIRYAGSDGINPRYYVPEWKREEERAKQARAQADADARAALREAAIAERRAERAAAARKEAEEQLAAVKTERAAHIQAKLDRLARQEAVYQGFDPVEIEATKKAIGTMIRTTYPAVWTPEELTRALGLAPEKLQFVVFCAEAMVKDGQLGIGKKKVPA